MFDVGLSELVLIALLALIVLGPKRLPEAARIAGHWLGKLRRFITDVKQDFDQELRNAELTELYKLKQEIDETRRMVQDSSGRLLEQIGSVPTSDETRAAASLTLPSVSEPILAATATPKETPVNATSKKTRKKSATKAAHGRTRKAKRTKR